MSEKAIITLTIAVDDEPSHVAAMLVEAPAAHPPDALRNLAKRLVPYAAGIRLSKFFLRVSSTEEGDNQGVFESGNPYMTLTYANITADETFSIGGTTFTWKASAANENQVTIGANLAEARANAVAKINGHSQLEGLVEATAHATTEARIDLALLADPRMGMHVFCSETGDALTFNATSFAPDTTDAFVGGTGIVESGL